MRGRAGVSAARYWLARHLAAGLLAGTLSGLSAGAILHGAGFAAAGDLAWLIVGASGLAYALWAMSESLLRHRVGVDLLAVLALAGAIAVRELLAAAVVSVMLASGRALESWAAARARRDLSGLLERAPREARVYRGSSLVTVPLDEIGPGDVMLVAHGDVVPVDGTVVSASAVLDESALTGEPLPAERPAGDRVRSGAANAGPAFDLAATASAADSTYAGIVRLVAGAEQSQAPFVRLADRYALWFLLVSVVTAGTAWALADAGRAVAVLVVATPCPLILAAPVALVSGMSAAARRGVVVKSGGVLEALARCRTLLLDKTGTLTRGHPEVTAIVSSGTQDATGALCLAASLDQVSGHVLAAAVVRAAGDRDCELVMPEDTCEVAGQGIRGTVAGHRVAVGKAAWCGIRRPADLPGWAKVARRRARLDGSLTVFVAVDGSPAAVLMMDDPVRPDAARTIRALRAGGIRRLVMVTGDRAEVAETVGAVIGIDEVLAERTPAEKVAAVGVEQRRGPVIMVGDGINDAPALALADVGVAVGAPGVTGSAQAADAVLTVNRIDRLGDVVSLARRTRTIALESVLAGMGMSLAAMGAAAAGLLPAVWGAVLQEVIDVVVILNALRALRPGGTAVRISPELAALSQRFEGEHETIRAGVDEIRAVADCLGVAADSEAIARIGQLHRVLVSVVEPHEQAEERELYPRLDKALGWPGATATMSRGHAEIAHQIRRLGQLLDEIGDGPLDEADAADLRALLYGLHAVLKLHTAQEDESYLSLAEPPAVPGRPETRAAARV
ncbi:MAG TPA: heavy metal translocating P-type ATPase [Streptosporangiaceae bacterium]|nr:heavy metal translocating P-type ATPase [Streptosporangiaceae bacterium]